ncbi:hypothetical protein X801_09105 [Opisthorchis viverrini]|uniref:Uncharacterized protein n=1 Tax=Opisthorchis viverrini TaxID=6198 RepID=A0A1S8WKW7_OPIVI|nr:hypothetical protein X801_09105 [Opisthorchis viverrini]
MKDSDVSSSRESATQVKAKPGSLAYGTSLSQAKYQKLPGAILREDNIIINLDKGVPLGSVPTLAGVVRVPLKEYHSSFVSFAGVMHTVQLQVCLEPAAAKQTPHATLFDENFDDHPVGVSLFHYTAS